jgi:ankyrin repeat protein
MYFRHLILVALLAGSSITNAQDRRPLANNARMLDCVRFAANGNDVVVDNECLKNELRLGANPNAVTAKGPRLESVLAHYVEMISLSRDPQVRSAGLEAVRSLIGAGAKLQAADAGILFWPVSSGNVALVQVLLDLGASATSWPARQLGTDLSPVEAAAAEGHDDIVDLLVERGAQRPDRKQTIQESFVRAASRSSIQELEGLLLRGANVNGKSKDNEAALTNAITWSYTCESFPKIRWLLEKGADPNVLSKGFLGTQPALHLAVWVDAMLLKAKRERKCSEQVIHHLLKHGAHVSGVDPAGLTPLHVAAKNNNVPAARLLIQSGAKIMPRDQSGKTPLDLAESSEMIKLLKQNGATER